jgi:hypothetical protein
VRLAEIGSATECGRMEWAVLDWNEPAIQFYPSWEPGRTKVDYLSPTRDGIAQLARESEGK